MQYCPENESFIEISLGGSILEYDGSPLRVKECIEINGLNFYKDLESGQKFILIEYDYS